MPPGRSLIAMAIGPKIPIPMAEDLNTPLGQRARRIFVMQAVNTTIWGIENSIIAAVRFLPVPVRTGSVRERFVVERFDSVRFLRECGSVRFVS